MRLNLHGQGDQPKNVEQADDLARVVRPAAKAQLNEVAISSDVFFILTRDAEVILEAASGGQRRCAANHNGAGARGLSFWFGLFCPLRV